MYDFENLPTAEKLRQNGVFDAVLLKAKWAHDHIYDLNNALDIFFDSNPYRIRHEQDSETLAYIYYFVGSNPFRWKSSGMLVMLFIISEVLSIIWHGNWFSPTADHLGREPASQSMIPR